MLDRTFWSRRVVVVLLTVVVLVVAVRASVEREGVGRLSAPEIEERLQVWDGGFSSCMSGCCVAVADCRVLRVSIHDRLFC